MSIKQPLEERLKKTVAAMRRTEPDSGIDLCHIVAVEEAIDRLAKFAAFAGPDGEPRNVLGTLPITADGAIAIPFMSVVYHPDHPTRTLDVDVCQDEVIGQVGVPGDDCTEWHEYAIRDCYSTRTAAEAAKEKEPNK